MATNVNTQVLSFYRGADVDFNFTPVTATDITGWTLAFTISDYPQQTPVVLTVADGSITRVSAAAGTFTVPLTRTQTSGLTNSQYYFDIWRINAGSYERLAGGKLSVNPPEFLPEVI